VWIRRATGRSVGWAPGRGSEDPRPYSLRPHRKLLDALKQLLHFVAKGLKLGSKRSRAMRPHRGGSRVN